MTTISWDERGLLRDGATYRVPLMMADSMADSDAESVPARSQFTDAEHAALNSCKPGYRYATDSAAARAARQKVRDSYKSYIDDLTNAWRGNPPTGGGSGDLLGQREGDLCTINSTAGRLRKIDGEFVCVADNPLQDARRDPDGDENGDDDENDNNNNENETDGDPPRRRRWQNYDPQGRESGSWETDARTLNEARESAYAEHNAYLRDAYKIAK
jgi:hypothetical protein